MNKAVFEKTFPVRYHELDYRGDAKLLTLLHCIQDAAGMHARILGVSVTDLHSMGLTWVLSRLHLIVDRYQRAEESIHVRTWPSSRQGLFTCREFLITDNSGLITARATTSWAAVKLATRRPVRLEEHLPAYPMYNDRALDDPFASLPAMPEMTPCIKIPFRVQRSDLDINNHVNNAVYAGWALEAVPDEIAKKRLNELEISYRAEAVYGDTILSCCSITESDCCLHRISSNESGREIGRLRSRWQQQ